MGYSKKKKYRRIRRSYRRGKRGGEKWGGGEEVKEEEKEKWEWEEEEERTASCARLDLEIYHSFLLHLVGHVHQLLVKLKCKSNLILSSIADPTCSEGFIPTLFIHGSRS